MLHCRYCDYHIKSPAVNQTPFDVYHCDLMNVALSADVEKYADEHPCSSAKLQQSMNVRQVNR